jgi:hypothetical protein
MLKAFDQIMAPLVTDIVRQEQDFISRQWSQQPSSTDASSTENPCHNERGLKGFSSTAFAHPSIRDFTYFVIVCHGGVFSSFTFYTA